MKLCCFGLSYYKFKLISSGQIKHIAPKDGARVLWCDKEDSRDLFFRLKIVLSTKNLLNSSNVVRIKL